jgi:putative methyltransferase (TIGR04325 family)
LQSSVRVLDFGGGLAEPYVFLINSLQDASKVDYRVVDLLNVCEEGRRVFRNYPGIQFQPDLPPVTFAPDIVYTSGAIQFVKHYRQTIQRFGDYNAPFVLVAELPAGSIPTFVSTQTNVSGHPVWFFSLAEIIDHVSGVGEGYELVLDAQFETEQNMRNFPASHRLDNYHTLLFCRRDYLRKMQDAVGS